MQSYNFSLCQYSSQRETISETVHIIGSLEHVWSCSALLTDEQLPTLPRQYGKIWMFRRCLVNGVVFHSKSYKRVVAWNDYTVEFQHLQCSYYGSIHTYVQFGREGDIQTMTSQTRDTLRTLRKQVIGNSN